MKTIIIGLNWLGDIIMSLPAIMAATENSEVHLVTRPHLAQVYELFGLPLHIHPVATDATSFQLIKALAPLRRLKAANTIIFPDSLRAAIIARLCHSRQSVGFNTQWRSLLLNRAVKKPDNFKKMHESELHFMLIKAAGLTDAEYCPEIPRRYFSPDKFTALANKLKLPTDKPYAVLAPGAAFGAAKRWPPAKFAALAGLLAAQNELTIVATGSSSETKLVDDLQTESSVAIINAAGRTSISELACLLSRAQLLVANDSGTMHLAALYATPTVVPVGPTDMTRTGPLNSNFRAVMASDVCPIAPCRQKSCPRPDHICMNSISPADIMTAVHLLLPETKRR